jgi:SAM-dependent methyltransferase
MDRKTILNQKAEVEEKYGPWTAHNIHLQDDLYTIAPKITGDEIKLRRITQCVLDLVGGSVEGLRILDLACLEGMFAIEFARQGAQSVGIEGREANIAKARFTKQVLSLDNLRLEQDDVRNLSAKKYGQFDVVLCLGLLYHLDVPDVFSFIESLSEVCRKVCIVDTRVALSPAEPFSYKGHTYFGQRGEEHEAGDSQEAKTAKLWASLDNIENFWITRPTLYNALRNSGFTSVYECNVPAEPEKPADRLTFVAIKGQPVHLVNAPLMAEKPGDDVPEHQYREDSIAVESLRKVGAFMPRKMRKLGKTLLGRDSKLT